jgi:hypothetical protein
MKLRLKEDPREWRKSTLLTALGLALMSSLLRWRHVLSTRVWFGVLVIAALGALVAWLRPRWLRGYYRASVRAGFWLSQVLAQIVLVLIFLVLVTPFGWLLRVLGKDPLRLRRTPGASSYWTPCRKSTPLDQSF